MDTAHKQTDKIIAELEKQIQQEYQKAYTQVRKEMADVFAKMQLAGDFKERFELSMKYDRLTKLSERCSEIIRTASVNATRIINKTEPNVYALNYNELAGELNMPVLPKSVIKKVVEEEINPYTKIAEMKLKNIDSIIGNFETAILDGFKNGEGTTKIAKRIKNLLEINTRDAQRIARTESTRIENQARNDVGRVGKEKYGLNIWKRWVATKDDRTRHEHLAMDGQEVPFDEPFVMPNGDKMLFPGDTSYGADASNTINCRCTFVEFVKEESIIEETYKKTTEEEFEKITDKIWDSKDENYEILENSKYGYINTETGSSKINTALRTDNLDSLDEQYKKTIRILDEEIAKNSSTENLETHRYVNKNYLSSVFGINYNDENIDNVIDDMKKQIGTIIQDKSFTSVSAVESLNVYKEYPIRMKILLPSGTHYYTTANYYESELILARNSKFQLVDVAEYNGKETIYGEETKRKNWLELIFKVVK